MSSFCDGAQLQADLSRTLLQSVHQEARRATLLEGKNRLLGDWIWYKARRHLFAWRAWDRSELEESGLLPGASYLGPSTRLDGYFCGVSTITGKIC